MTDMFEPHPFLSAEWTGRDDGPGPEHARWHSDIQPLSSNNPAGIAILGFASDEGVRRNGGRVGAAEGPAAIRRALASLAIHHETPLYDAGTITVSGEDLESGHYQLSSRVQELVESGHLVIVLGGGHETAFGTHRGLFQAAPEATAVVNLDAHFDLRQADRATSGTPFKQIADLRGPDFCYTVMGISRPNNTRALFEIADSLNAGVVTDEELAFLSPAECAQLAGEATQGHDAVHLSIDLDVLPAAVAPGVSAPAAWGVELTKILAITRALALTGKLRLVDVVELNPEFDIDGRTAKVAARIVEEIVTGSEDSDHA